MYLFIICVVYVLLLPKPEPLVSSRAVGYTITVGKWSAVVESDDGIEVVLSDGTHAPSRAVEVAVKYGAVIDVTE